MNLSNTKRILVVEDEEFNRDLLESMLESMGHEVEFACDGMEALGKLRLDIDLVLLDLMMPVMDGYEVTKKIREDKVVGNIPIIMLTALGDRQYQLRAVEAGVNDFICKPIDESELNLRVSAQLKMYESHKIIKQHEIELEDKIKRRTESLRQTLDEMIEAKREIYKAQLETIHRLAIAAEYKDMGTATHIQRMSSYSVLLAEKSALSPKTVEIVKYSSIMHDVGKLGIPDNILLKPGKLDEKEWGIMKMHTIYGAEILGGSSSELLNAGEIIAMTHHEKWDGSGYPKGLKGDEIHVFGQICAISDVFDALTSKRPYKKMFSNEEALKIIEEGRGKHFSPQLVDKFLNSIDEISVIQSQQNCKSPDP